MDYYIDVRLLPDPEFPPALLMNALFAKLHRALFDLASTRVGVSFPGVSEDRKRPALGDHLRLHGTAADLQRLMALNWLTGMNDHTELRGPAAVPAQTSYRVVRRVQAKSNPERLRRRLVRRQGLSDEAARAAIPDSRTTLLDLPFVTIASRSTGQSFKLFVEHRPPVAEPADGLFSNYGLSPTATVPWF